VEHVDEHLRAAAWVGASPLPPPHGVGLRTYMLAAVIIFGTVVAVIGIIALLLNLD
jgi:hypothetical protein